MRLKLEAATLADAEAIASLHNAVAEDLVARHGPGRWSRRCTAQGVRFHLRTGLVYVARRNGSLLATLKLSTTKPWAIDRKFFSKVGRPLYLTHMAVAPGWQRQGLGRLCLAAAVRLAQRWPADAIFLDAFDHAGAGAEDFYRKCGYREVGRASYREVPLIYFELLLPGGEK